MKVAFIDRDGTLVFEPKDGLVRPDDLRILPGVIEGLKALKAAGYAIVMVTNQDFAKSADHAPFFDQTQVMLRDQFKKEGIVFDQIFLCPHSPSAGCDCRKPKPGMVTKFLSENTIDKDASMVIGDRPEADGGLAQAIGVRYVKVGPNGAFASIEALMSGL